MRPKSTNPDDYQHAQRPLGVMQKMFADGTRIGLHHHARAQCIYARTGLMHISTEAALWLIPPQHALWMPSGVAHTMLAQGDVHLQTLYVQQTLLPPDWQSELRVIRVSPLLRELIARAAEIPLEYAENSHEASILQLLLNEIQQSGDAFGPCLLTARDSRLQYVCEAILANPADRRNLEEWAQVCGASSRTLARLFQREFGVSFIVWRQQVRILSALPRLAAGEPVTRLALECGYETPGAFTRVFKLLMGQVPSEYLATL
ncbi:MAG: helix-turn-helix transcriptional regulator [Burkholderiales bacterium]|nr:helix-turn-helix transcriptional regulator [Burkholderiales bacterium]